MPLPALMILIITLAVFATLAAIVIIKRGDLVFPKGNVTPIKEGAYTAYVIFGPGVEMNDESFEVASACHKAAVAADAGFNLTNRKPKRSIKEIAVNFVTDDMFVYSGYGKEFDAGVMGFLTECKKSFAKGIPMAVLRERLMNNVKETGEPVIHELMHALLGETNAIEAIHEEKDIWAMHGDNTAQARAREIFKHPF